VPAFDVQAGVGERSGELGLDAACLASGDAREVLHGTGQETFEAVMLGRPKIAEELSETLAQRKVELMAVKEGLDAKAMKARHASERDRILGGIKAFFGL